MWSRASAWSLGWLLAIGCGSFGCGSTTKNGQPPPAEGAAGEPSTAPSADETAGYEWNECGRIAPSTFVRGATYASDGSVITLEASGRVRLFPPDSNVATTLLPDQGIDVQDPAALALSPDGVWLLLGTEPTPFAREDRAPIVAGSPTLVAAPALDVAGNSCAGSASFAFDSARLLSSDADTLCVWEIATGALLQSYVLMPESGRLEPTEGVSADGVLTLRNDTLLRYDAQGVVAGRFDLVAHAAAPARGAQSSFSPDGRYLVLQVWDVATVGLSRLLTLDTQSGDVVWHRELTAAGGIGTPGFVISPDSTVLLVVDGLLLGLSDGSELGSDVPDFFHGPSVLAPGGQRLLRVREQVAEWDVQGQELLRLYGAHQQAIRDLDVTPDGQHFASHGDLAVTWQMNTDDFSRSLPLFRGAAPDESWNVALDPEGEVMSVSGDNVMFFKRRGEHWYVGAPPGAAGCLSADWAFSPLGGVAAGSHYDDSVTVVDTASLSTTTSLDASNCAGGIAFSPDGSLLATASLELFDTATWRSRWTSPAMGKGAPFSNAEDDVVFSPDGSELVVSRCSEQNEGCTATRYRTVDASELGRVPQLTGEQVRYSPEGHWLVSKRDLVHLPTGATSQLEGKLTVSAFTPEGDIISGEPDGSLVRYCRAQ